MVEPRPVSPILDGLELNPIPFSRHGVGCCCHASDASGKPVVVKIIPIPPSATQMDALLLTGAFADRAAANAYFKEQARDVLNEAKTLRHLAALGGFADFDSVQVVPAPADNGFEVYLVRPEQTCLEALFRQNDLTQMQLINMGLDICAALTTCRRSGFFYADLKPSNVFFDGAHYRIGDLGLMPLSALGRRPVAEQYRSNYTPPELRDGAQNIHGTADVYALGMMFYEAYNGGVLPGEGDRVGQLLAPPKYADYELAEIILRACAPDPTIRWQSPEQMGHALARYAHRNGLHDTRIVPRPVVAEMSAPVEDFLPEPESEEEIFEVETPPIAEPPKTPDAPVRPGILKRIRPIHVAIGLLVLILLMELIVGGLLLRGGT